MVSIETLEKRFDKRKKIMENIELKNALILFDVDRFGEYFDKMDSVGLNVSQTTIPNEFFSEFMDTVRRYYYSGIFSGFSEDCLKTITELLGPLTEISIARFLKEFRTKNFERIPGYLMAPYINMEEKFYVLPNDAFANWKARFGILVGMTGVPIAHFNCLNVQAN